VGAGQPRRLFQLGVGGIRLADPQVVGDAAVKQQALLKNHPGVHSQGIDGHITNIDAVDADGASLRSSWRCSSPMAVLLPAPVSRRGPRSAPVPP